MKQRVVDFLLKKIFFKKGVKFLKNKKGFSLVEIMVALGLLVVVGGIAVPQYTAYTERARRQAVDSSVGTIRQAVGACMAIENDTDECLDDTINGTLQANPGIFIERATGTDVVCFFVLEHKGTTDPTKVPEGKMYAIEVFDEDTGKVKATANFRVKDAKPAASDVAWTVCT